MSTTVEQWLENSPERNRLYAQEGFILDVTEEIWDAMTQQGISKADLARLLSSSKANITQLLSGSRNMTLRTLSDIAEALEQKIHFYFEDKLARDGWKTTATFQSRRPPVRPAALDIAANDEWTTPTPLRVVAAR